MDKEKSDSIYLNRADVEELHDHTSCDKCLEPLVFAMKDNYHEFSVGLSTILECLAIAEKEGCIPQISEEWWIEVSNYVEG